MSRTARTQTEWSNRWQILVFTCRGRDSYDCEDGDGGVDGDDVDGDDVDVCKDETLLWKSLNIDNS